MPVVRRSCMRLALVEVRLFQSNDHGQFEVLPLGSSVPLTSTAGVLVMAPAPPGSWGLPGMGRDAAVDEMGP